MREKAQCKYPCVGCVRNCLLHRIADVFTILKKHNSLANRRAVHRVGWTVRPRLFNEHAASTVQMPKRSLVWLAKNTLHALHKHCECDKLSNNRVRRDMPKCPMFILTDANDEIYAIPNWRHWLKRKKERLFAFFVWKCNWRVYKHQNKYVRHDLFPIRSLNWESSRLRRTYQGIFEGPPNHFKHVYSSVSFTFGFVWLFSNLLFLPNSVYKFIRWLFSWRCGIIRRSICRCLCNKYEYAWNTLNALRVCVLQRCECRCHCQCARPECTLRRVDEIMRFAELVTWRNKHLNRYRLNDIGIKIRRHGAN